MHKTDPVVFMQRKTEEKQERRRETEREINGLIESEENNTVRQDQINK